MVADLPRHDRLADDLDQIDWDRSRLGPMADAATPPEGEPVTEPISIEEALRCL